MANVLIVEDNAAVAEVYAEALKDHATTISRRAEDAVLLAFSSPFDLILLDLAFPSWGGIMAALALRGAGVDTPIMVVTGGAVAVDPRLIEMAKIGGWIEKPILPGDLLKAVEQQLGGK